MNFIELSTYKMQLITINLKFFTYQLTYQLANLPVNQGNLGKSFAGFCPIRAPHPPFSGGNTVIYDIYTRFRRFIRA